ncbi:hypothetical protein HUO09_17825 [Vibrio sp. Y2-5]|uniref:hypothetical protein n=1 Tax=Vibrio sp. Y2-5 TaxID=2743977 RepID=UPI0016610D57|nr:hypothetical protein [Vibrio sp. Y2-5]MBD0788218.1 hypothetical protein [Vibrio sp. Y2-5]
MQLSITEIDGEMHVLQVGTNFRTAFSLAVKDEIALVVDTTNGRNLTTVTNSAEMTIEAIKVKLGRLPSQIIYRDTDFCWSRLNHDGTKFSGFSPLKHGVIGDGITAQQAFDIVSIKTIH